MNKLILKLSVCSLLAVTQSVAAHVEESGETQVIEQTAEFVTPNVAFSAVMKLPFDSADKKISYGEDALQYGLLWRGKGPEKGPENNPKKNRDKAETDNKPLLMLIHGGCWLNAFGVDHGQPMSSALAQAGFDVWAVEYRRTGDEGGGWPGSFDDIKASLAYVKNLPEGVNKEEVVLIGHSAGGHLALLMQQEHSEDDQPKIVQTIGLAAITDMVSYAQGSNSCQTAGPKFMGGMPKDLPDAYQAADPKQHEPYANTLLLQGQADVIVPEQQAKLAGAVTIKLASAGHFDWIHPQSKAFAALLAQLKQYKSKETVDNTTK